MQQNLTYNNTLLIQDILGRKKMSMTILLLFYTLQLKILKQIVMPAKLCNIVLQIEDLRLQT